MFSLPEGIEIEGTISVEQGAIQTFDNGSITSWIGRRKTPAGHRLVRAGRTVGWLVESGKGKLLLGGKEAREHLQALESKGSVRHTATSYSLSALGSIAEAVPEAFEFAVERQGLLARGDALERLMSRDLSAVLAVLVKRETVRGAIAVDQGLLIDSVGELPADSEQLAAQLHTMLSEIRMEELNDGFGLEGSSHWTLHSNDGALLLAESGDNCIGVWTEANANHARILSATAAILDGELGSIGSHGGAIPEGFVLREGRGGPDAILSMLTAGISEEVTGHLQAGQSENAVSLLLSRGVPVGLSAPNCDSFEEAMLRFTDSSWVLKLHRLPVGSIVSRDSGTFDEFTLSHFQDLLTTLRTRSESRRANMQSKLKQLFGFEVGMETLRAQRATAEFSLTVDEVAQGLPTDSTEVLAIDSGLRRRLESSEEQIAELVKEKAALSSRLDEAYAAQSASDIILRNATESKMTQTTSLEERNAALDTMQLDLAEARVTSEKAENRAERLVKRVNELEHQVSTRAAELAKALGDSDSSEALRVSLEEKSLKEAELNSELSASSERLATIRQQSQDDERRLRVLQEQVEATRERHTRAQAEVMLLDEKIHSNQSELETIDSEAKAARRRAEEDRTRLTTDESRQAQVHAEIKELMGERRQVLRELGDLGARRGHAEAELMSLIERAEALSQAHEDALSDIQEAERLRARLAEEPLAQALLDDTTTFEGLGPVLERLESARALGYSVTLLDRAVERGLQVIQSTVDHVAATPRHLLSSEVMTLLERQVPQTAGAVRGLARWSVQQRLEHQLGETVGHVVIDLEHLLEDFDRSITMLRRLRNVLEQLVRLGAPPHEVEALLNNCTRPEALPSIAKETRKLIQVALDDIYLEADQRDAGEAIALEETARVLEELITQLDASGLADGVPRGMLWEFQRDGLLPYERNSVPDAQRTPVEEDMLVTMESSLAGPVPVSLDAPSPTTEVDDDGWEELPLPMDDEIVKSEPPSSSPVETTSLDQSDERAVLEDELARLDAAWNHRKEPAVEQSQDPALAALSARLSGLDL
jgi:predicted regulator of Ras-like GTPase activity (Roadblock/LC7/MglB family)